MLRNFLLISFRNIRQNKGASLLNILCLALGMATCLFIFNYLYYELTYERFHENQKEIFRVETHTLEFSDLKTQDAFTPPSVGMELVKEYEQITESTTLLPYSENGSAFFIYQNSDSTSKTIFVETTYFAQPSFFSLFTLELLAGDKDQALNQPLSIILSASKARSIFGAGMAFEQMLGKSMEAASNNSEVKEFIVTGIFEDLPANTHLDFDALVSMATYANDLSLRTAGNSYNYVRLDPEHSKRIKAELASQSRSQGINSNLSEIWSLRLISEIHLAAKISHEPGVKTNFLFLSFLALIGFIILTLACTNFVNNAIINSIERAREVGIRKLAGILPRQLFFTLITESALINTVAGVLGLGIFSIGLRYILTNTDINYPVTFSSHTILFSLVLLVALIIISTLLAGIYPATLLVSIKPVEALKGKSSVINSRQSSRSSKVMRVLLVFQLAMSIIFISGVYVVYQQLNHIRRNDNRPFQLNATARFGGLSGVNDIYAASSRYFLAGVTQSSSIRVRKVTNLYNGQIKTVQPIKSLYQIDKDTVGVEDPFYLEIIDHEYWQNSDSIFLSGSNFDKVFGRDFDRLIINESALNAMKFAHPDNAIGKVVGRYEGFLTIKGVVKNESADEPPRVFATGYRYPTYFELTLTTLGGSAERINGTLAATQRQWEKQFPWIYFVDRKFEDQSALEENLLNMFFLFTFIAVSIACLGIFGLSSFTALKRTKEIGIRKILGANSLQILFILIYDFLRLIFYSSLLAIPIVILGARQWLMSYAERIELPPLFMGVPIVLMSVLAIGIIIKQCWYVTVSHPIQVLAKE